jgi:hypothetical protein
LKSGLKDHLFLIVGVGIAVIVFVVLIATSSKKGGVNTTDATSGSTPASASLIHSLSTVPMSTLETIGFGSASKPFKISAPALKAKNKPEVFYEGAEYCPYCATERWAMAVALSKFGTFKTLRTSHSSNTDVYPDTQTLSFYKAQYSSPYITFTPLEIYTNIANSIGYTALQTPTAAQTAFVNKYDAAPYVSKKSSGGIPFIDFGGKHLITGATYDPQVLQGLSVSDISSMLASTDQTDAVARGVDGAANTMIASICQMTNNQPGNVCTPAMQTLESKL